jgi:hypothetical protein
MQGSLAAVIMLYAQGTAGPTYDSTNKLKRPSGSLAAVSPLIARLTPKPGPPPSAVGSLSGIVKPPGSLLSRNEATIPGGSSQERGTKPYTYLCRQLRRVAGHAATQLHSLS